MKYNAIHNYKSCRCKSCRCKRKNIRMSKRKNKSMRKRTNKYRGWV